MERLNLSPGAPHGPLELAIHVARYAVAAPLCRGRRVVDAACGEGYGSWLMAERWGAASVHGVDVSAEALARARERFPTPKLTWVEADLDVLDPAALGAPFDLVVSLETLEHVRNPERFLRTLRALRAPGGALVLSCPNDRWYYGAGRSKNPWHRHTWTLEQFRTLAESVLGPARGYLLGSSVAGFCTVTAGDAVPSADLVAAVGRVHETSGVALPGADGFAPTADQSLYYVGLWGDAEPRTSVAWAPIAPGRPVGVDSVAPAFPYQRGDRPRIVLLADVAGWAYDNIARQIVRHLGDAIDFTVLYIRDYPDDWACLYDVLFVHEPDAVHFFWREFLFCVLASDLAEEMQRRHGVSPDDLHHRLARTVLTASIYDHLYADDEAIARRVPYLWFLDAYSVSSERLRGVYGGDGVPPPDVVIEDGVDLELFRPPPAAERPPSEALRVGWAGNSEWNRTPERDPKGLHTILVPALERLRREGVAVEGRFADSAVAPIPRDAMPAFYAELDVYVCVSEIEGTPNPILEAMACGLPVVTTDVGIVPELLGPAQRRFVLPQRSVDAVVEALRALAADPDLRRTLAEENLRRIREWTWAHMMPKWLQLFRIAAGRVSERSARRRFHLLAFAAAAIERKDRLIEEIVAAKDARIHATERLVEERWEIMQKMDGMIADRDAVIAATTASLRSTEAQLRSVEHELAVARSGSGALRNLAAAVGRKFRAVPRRALLALGGRSR